MSHPAPDRSMQQQRQHARTQELVTGFGDMHTTIQVERRYGNNLVERFM